SRYKAMLHDIHAEASTKKKPLLSRLAAFRPQHLRTAAMAASVALLTSAITVWTIRHEPKSAVSRNLELVKHDMERIKGAQQHQQLQIEQIKKEVADVTTTPQPPQSNYSATGFALSNDGYVITNYHVVEGAQNLRIVTRGGTSLAASVIAYEPKND